MIRALVLFLLISFCHGLAPSKPDPLNKCTPNRRAVLQTLTATVPFFLSQDAKAAPPIAIIAQELGYFPVTNKGGETVYIPATVRRRSTEQSIKLAQHLKKIGSTMYGAYWCPHCSHQKELFGREAWDLINYVECSTKGYNYDAAAVGNIKDKLTGFPTWKIGKQFISGEMPLERLVAISGYKGSFDALLEGPDISSSGACG
jgi:hypothetical protein